jgi:hypothetical protein
MLYSVGMSVLPWMLQCPRSPGCRRRAADVAQQRLDDAGRADDLHAGGVVRPGHGIAPSAGFLPAAVARQRLGDLQEGLARAAGDPLDHLRRVGGKVPAQDLVDAVRVLRVGPAGAAPC